MLLLALLDTKKSYVRQEKRHININFLVRVALGRHPVCSRDKPMFSSCFTQWKPSLSQSGTNRQRRAAEEIYVLNVYVPFSLANTDISLAGYALCHMLYKQPVATLNEEGQN